MPKQLTKERLKELYDAMPTEVARVYEGEETARLMLDIGRKHGLAIDKIGRLTEETGYVVTGAAPAREFIDSLEAALDVPRDKAVAIAREINSRIFAPIRESLKRMHGVSAHNPLLPEEADVEWIADSVRRIETEKLSAMRSPLSAESMSDRAYWGEVSKATHESGRAENGMQDDYPLSAIRHPLTTDAVLKENEKGTLIQIKQAEDKTAKETIEKELAAEVNKILKDAPAVPAASAAPLQTLSSKLDTESAPERTRDPSAPSTVATSLAAPPTASPAPVLPAPATETVKSSPARDSYREPIDD